jgi:hypothetical protein
VTGGESWCFQFDRETKRQNMELRGTKSPRQKKVRLQKSHVKMMVIVFFDAAGIIHREFVPEGTTVKSLLFRGDGTSVRARAPCQKRAVRKQQLAAVA